MISYRTEPAASVHRSRRVYVSAESCRDLLAQLGRTSASPKRLAAQAVGSVLKLAAGGQRGKLSLFQTLEALSIGVQGKRCMWRALQVISNLEHPGARAFSDLESSALRQWEMIEKRRTHGPRRKKRGGMSPLPHRALHGLDIRQPPVCVGCRSTQADRTDACLFNDGWSRVYRCPMFNL